MLVSASAAVRVDHQALAVTELPASSHECVEHHKFTEHSSAGHAAFQGHCMHGLNTFSSWTCYLVTQRPASCVDPVLFVRFGTFLHLSSNHVTTISLLPCRLIRVLARSAQDMLYIFHVMNMQYGKHRNQHDVEICIFTFEAELLYNMYMCTHTYSHAWLQEHQAVQGDLQSVPCLQVCCSDWPAVIAAC